MCSRFNSRHCANAPRIMPMLAEAFAQRFAQRLGKSIEPLTPDFVARLKGLRLAGQRARTRECHRARGYHCGRRANESGAGAAGSRAARVETCEADDGGRAHIHDAELEEMERRNFLRALEPCDWPRLGRAGRGAVGRDQPFDHGVADESAGSQAAGSASRIFASEVLRNFVEREISQGESEWDDETQVIGGQ